MDHPYSYVFIREDISLAQQMVQLAHSSLQAGFDFEKPEETSSIVLLSAKDKDELDIIGDRLDRHGIKFHKFFEPDFGMGHSSITTEPIHDMQTRRIMSKYKLYDPAKYYVRRPL